MSAAYGPVTPPGGRRGSAALTWVITVLVVVVALAGTMGRHAGGVVGAWDEFVRTSGQGTPPLPALADRDYPPPGQEEAAEPLGVPPRVTDPGASHAFTRRQATYGGTAPVTWSPCRPIHYVVDPTGAPPDFPERVAAVIAEVGAATGLAFIDDGSTTEQVSTSRAPFQPDLYGDRWAPALIRFASSAEIPEFADRYAGLGGPSIVTSQDGVQHLVSGFAYLDLDLLVQPDQDGEPAYVPVLRHEIGHMLGLAHVDDPTQLMHGDANLVTTFQSGDLAGLAALGGGPCAPSI